MSGAGDRILDNGLLALTTESDRVFLCATDPVDYTAASTVNVGSKIGSRGSMFFPLSTVTGGRMASMSGFNDGNITANGNANFVVVADSVNQRILISEALAVPKVVKSGGSFSINALDVVIGKSSQPQAASLVVASPVIDRPVFAIVPVKTNNFAASSPAFGKPALIETGSGWINIPFQTQTSVFTCDFDATPERTPIDCVIGLSDGPGADYGAVQVTVRFAPNGNIDALNADTYTALSVIPYIPGTKYRFRLSGDITTHLFSAWVTPEGGAQIQVASNYAFRTRDGAVIVSQLNNFIRYTSDWGNIIVSDLTFNNFSALSLTVGSPVIDQRPLNNRFNFVSTNLSVSSPVFPVIFINKITISLGGTAFTMARPAFGTPAIFVSSAPGYADGFIGSPAGPPNFPTLLNGYAVRPPWKVAGVDYHIGIDRTAYPTNANLRDPRTVTLPPGVTRGGPNGVRTLNISGTGNTLDGIDFSVDGGWSCHVTGTNNTVQNCYFEPGVNGFICLFGDNTAGPGCIVKNSEFTGAGNALQFLIALNGSMTMMYNIIQHCWGQNVVFSSQTGFGNEDLTFKWNYIADSGEGYLQGAHGDWVQTYNADFVDTNSYTCVFNTCVQTAQIANGPRTQGLSSWASDSGANSGGCRTETFENNVFIGKPGAYVNYAILIETSRLVNTGTIKNNYFDLSGIGVPQYGGAAWYAQHGTIRSGPYNGTVITSGNIDLITGGTVTA